MKTSVAFLIVVFGFLSCRKEASVPEEPVVETKLDVEYGSGPFRKMDVYLPIKRTSETPVIVFVHGGVFFREDKSSYSNISHDLSAKGFVVLNINYRLVDTVGIFRNPPVHQASAVKIKDQTDDIKAAVNFAASNSADWVMSTSKWGICGHGIGGTLALLTAYNYGSANPGGRIKAVANWAGVTDLSFWDESQLSTIEPYWREWAYRATGFEMVNGNKLAYMSVSPTWIAYNGHAIPTINIRPENNLMLGLPDNSRQLYHNFTNTLTAKGVANRSVEIAGASHKPWYLKEWEQMVNETKAWFDVHLK